MEKISFFQIGHFIIYKRTSAKKFKPISLHLALIDSPYLFKFVEVAEFVEVLLICAWYLSPFEPVCETCWLSPKADVALAFTAAEAVATLARVAAADVPGFVAELTDDDDDAAPLPATPPIK